MGVFDVPPSYHQPISYQLVWFEGGTSTPSFSDFTFLTQTITSMPTSLSFVSAGSSSQHWNGDPSTASAWTPSDINSSTGFGVAFAVSNSDFKNTKDAEVDVVQTKIHYEV